MALESYQQSLTVIQEVGDRNHESIILGILANLLREQDQPELAIIFYNKAVNT